MKRIGILLILISAFVFATYAEKSTLIDFSQLTGDVDVGDRQENEATLIDFSNKAGTGFTDEEKSAMKTSLKLENWVIVLASSSRTVVNQALSKTITAPVSENAAVYAGENVMGIRIHFPDEPFNSWAIVEPPFEIPAYEQKTTLESDGSIKYDEADVLRTKFDSIGVVKNVGIIKTLTMNVYGSNYPNGCGIILKDQDNKVQNIFMQNLMFDGWKTLTWKNPNYIEEVRNREVKQFPLYPKSTPMVKLMGLIFYKDAAQTGGDFITYVKDIEVTYDKAVLNLERDINEEALWGILTEREEARRTAEFAKLGNLQVLRYLESKKMHQEAATSED
ncbi:MAG: flagellar filament outer layer protein FlaA [Spirochaetales bacterium]|nr:flagellar filament outer layer protein FlaA [Spirochaetales bacterium]